MWSKHLLSVLFASTLVLCAWSYRRTDHESVPVVFRPPPLSSDFISPTCWNFTYGDRNKMEFFSPNYPNNYSSQADCIQYLEAPKGYRIYLDFRNEFVLEESRDCTYDYLEIRDGPFGYSPLMKRLCGHDFPPIFVSSTRYLWLRFKTDDLVHKQGFHATYSYEKDESNKFSRDPRKAVCRIFINPKAKDGIISEDDVPTSVINIIKRAGRLTPIDCTWEIRAPPDSKVQLRPLMVDFSKPEKCELNFMSMYMSTTVPETMKVKYCSGRKVESIHSVKNRLFLRVFSKTILLMPKFRFSYTIYRNGECSEKEFSCDDRCLHKSLHCNKNKNCDDDTDENSCNVSPGLDIPQHTIILGSIGFVLLQIVLISVCFTLKHKKKEQKKQVEMLKQQAKQSEAAVAAAAAANNPQMPSTPTRGGMVPSPGLRQNTGSQNSYVSLPRRNDGSGGVNPKDNANRVSLTSTLQPILDNENITMEQLMDTSYFKKYFPAEGSYDDEVSPSSTLISGQPTTVLVERHQPPQPILGRDGSAYWKTQNTGKLEHPVPPFFTSLNRTTPYKGSVSPNTILKDPLSNKPLPSFNSDLELDNGISPF